MVGQIGQYIARHISKSIYLNELMINKIDEKSNTLCKYSELLLYIDYNADVFW